MARAARLKRVPGIVGIWLAIAGCQAVDANEPVRVEANDNRTPAGRLERDVLTVQLEAREGRWHPNGDQAEGLVMQVFAESGRAPQNPGPMLRVVTGTTIRASVHNALPDSLIVYGLHTRPGTIEDTLHLTPGETREVSFAVGAPGTYFYWGSTTHEDIFDRNGKDSQLLGAFIVDSTGPTRPDRVFVLGSWTGPVDTTLGFGPELRVINGLSWPHTERLTYTAGDTVIWRWVNPTDSPHPMHLHGFYFDILSRGNWAADTVFAPDARPLVVTEMPVPGQTFTMRWAPTEPGNWLFHCHVAFHTSLFLGTKIPPDPADPLAVHHTQGMQGMIMALTVHPGASAARRPDNGPNARNIRLIAQAAPRRFKGTLDELAFVRQDGAELPVARQVIRPSFLLAGPGETMDFEFTPTAPGMLRLEVEQRTGAFKNNLPIKVDR